MRAEKAALRRACKARIAALEPAYCAAADAAIARRLWAQPFWREARTVFCYVGAAGEIDTRPILRAALAQGKLLAVPLCVAPGVMEARRIQTLDALRPGRYGLPEPPSDAPRLAPEALQLCLLPCLSAAPDGARLGYGGGYYDRFLPLAVRAHTVALCRAALLAGALPCEAHDLRAQAVLTENALYRPETPVSEPE